MRLGGKVTPLEQGPEAWIAAIHAKGYRAAYCPLPPGTLSTIVTTYRAAAADADIVIAEVGIWKNPMSPDPAEASAAYAKCVAGLALADEIGARCCVNLAGSRGEFWAGHHPDNFSDETFDLIVETTQKIIDEVQPRHTVYALEAMPWMVPHSIESYQRLVAAVDRPQFGVHFDPVNLVNSPARYYGNADLIRDFVAAFGNAIRSVHVKDMLMHQKLTVHIDEVRPGAGYLALDVLLTELANLDADLPIMLEQLPDEAEYDAATAHLREVASAGGLTL
jgi:sugar phosphate isomerase/epimerase